MMQAQKNIKLCSNLFFSGDWASGLSTYIIIIIIIIIVNVSLLKLKKNSGRGRFI
jgi:hypothetical protein